MNRVAIFVDAGYLYAQGLVALAGSIQPRSAVNLRRVETKSKLLATADKQTGNAPLLRIYWYDGMLSSGPSPEQQDLAHTDDVKLRLGFVNAAGQQKGVDSLIVTDLIDLARNHAITDAVLLSGDEDIRIGVQIAQSFGVRVHLIGITPSRGSQSMLLLQESDTAVEWSNDDVRHILEINPRVSIDAVDGNLNAGGVGVVIANSLDIVVDEFVGALDFDELTAAVSKLSADLSSIPPEYDRPILAASRSAIDRKLDWPELNYLRSRFRDKIGDRV